MNIQLDQVKQLQQITRDKLTALEEHMFPFVAYDLICHEAVVIVGEHSPSIWRQDDGCLVEKGDVTRHPLGPTAYKEMMAKRLELRLRHWTDEDFADEKDTQACAMGAGLQ